MRIDPPYALLAELTHRCPLQCLYCSNPVELTKKEDEMDIAQWCRLLEDAASLGCLQVHFSGGEPLVKAGLPELVDFADKLGLYTNLITSGIGLDERRFEELREAGLASVQLSIQADQALLVEDITGLPVLDQKLAAARLVSASDIALTLNCVLTRQNIDRLDGILSLLVPYAAGRIELANCQYHGWAGTNQAYLLPDKEQVERAFEVYLKWRSKLDDSLELLWVKPDIYEDFAKPCMGGWASSQLTVNPEGLVMPCPGAAVMIPALEKKIPRLNSNQSLRYIWYESDFFNLFRGFEWMSEPCRSCERRALDFGGCRCQAFALLGDASLTDPACIKSPHHGLMHNHENQSGDKLYRKLES